MFLIANDEVEAAGDVFPVSDETYRSGILSRFCFADSTVIKNRMKKVLLSSTFLVHSTTRCCTASSEMVFTCICNFSQLKYYFCAICALSTSKFIMSVE